MSLLKLPKVAERLDCSVMTVRRLIERGELRAVRVGRVLRVAEQDLADYIERNAANAGGGAA